MNCEDMFEYRPWNGAYNISEFLRRNDQTVTAIEIPSEHGGLPVVGASNTAFARAPYIESVFVPDCCLVSAEMFFKCKRLKKARVGGEVVCKGAFDGCTALERVDFSESVRRIDQSAFMGCKSLKKVVLPRNLEEIGDFAFARCTNLRELVFPEKRVKIGMLAFAASSKLPAETRLYSLIGANDIGEPVKNGLAPEMELLFDKDVFATAVEHNCLRELDKTALLKELIKRGKRELYPTAEALFTEDVINELIRFCAEEGKTEETAWLLDYKNREFGFDEGDNYEL